MGKATKPQKVKLFIGLIFKDPAIFDKTKQNLRSKFGKIDFASPTIDFTYTDHYEKELGANLKRKFISFVNLIPPDKISKIKLITNKVEKRFSDPSGNRRINIDPGYINAAKVVLVTTKDYSHRLYLKDGIYAEITLSFTKGRFKPSSWSYPDYQTRDYLDIFDKIRGIFMQQRNEP